MDLTDRSLKLENFSDKAKQLSIVSISRTCVGLRKQKNFAYMKKKLKTAKLEIFLFKLFSTEISLRVSWKKSHYVGQLLIEQHQASFSQN